MGFEMYKNLMNIQYNLLKGLYFDDCITNNNYNIYISNIITDNFWNVAIVNNENVFNNRKE